MRRVMWHMHDVYANSVHSRPKLLVVKWLGSGLNVTVRVRYRKWVSFLFFIFESDNIFVLPSWPETWFNIQCHLWQYDVNMMYGNVHSEPSMYHLHG